MYVHTGHLRSLKARPRPAVCACCRAGLTAPSRTARRHTRQTSHTRICRRLMLSVSAPSSPPPPSQPLHTRSASSAHRPISLTGDGSTKRIIRGRRTCRGGGKPLTCHAGRLISGDRPPGPAEQPADPYTLTAGDRWPTPAARGTTGIVQ